MKMKRFTLPKRTVAVLIAVTAGLGTSLASATAAHADVYGSCDLSTCADVVCARHIYGLSSGA